MGLQILGKFKFNFVERKLSKFFYHHAKWVSRCPLFFLLCPLLLSFGLGLGCFWYFHLLKDEISLYTPSNGRARLERSILENRFPIDDVDTFYSERRYELDRTGFILLTAPYEGNVLSPSSLNEALQLWHRIETLQVWTNGSWTDYRNLCVKYSTTGKCIQNPILALLEANPMALKFLGQFATSNFVSLLGNFVGGLVIGPQNGTLFSARALLLPYQLLHSTSERSLAAQSWENRLDQFLRGYDTLFFDKYWWTSETLSIEADKDTKILLKLLGPLLLVITLFTIAACVISDWIWTRALMGVGGVFSACCAVISAVGLLSYLGQGFTSLAYFMPFVVISIGVDNVFILLASWQKTSTHLSVEERMALVFEDAGVSITVTLLTDGLSFATGCLTSFLSVHNFCLYAAVAIGFVYIYQLTLYTAIMVFTCRLESSEKLCQIGTNRSNVDPPGCKPPEFWESSKEETSKGRPPAVRDHLLARFFKTTYTTIITQPLVQGAAVVLFLGYIITAAIGCTQIKIGLEPIDLLPKTSEARKTLTVQEKYFSTYGDNLQVVFTDLAKLDYQGRFWEKIDQEIRRFEGTKYSSSADSWLRAFLTFADSSAKNLSIDNFLSVLQTDFLTRPEFQKYQRDIVFAANGTRLLGSRIPVGLLNVGYHNQSDAMLFFRSIADTASIDTTVYNQFFDFADQYGSILSSTLMNVAIASAAVILVSLILIPKPLCSVWLCVTIISIDIGILGYMSFWGVKLDFISMVTIVMSIGFCVDFAAHVAYHFAKEESLGPVDRLRNSLYLLGTPILESAGSTALGVSLLVVVDNYIYRAFVKTILLVILLGIFHGLFVLPVFLTIFYCKKSGIPVENSSENGKSDAGAANSEGSSGTMLRENQIRPLFSGKMFGAHFTPGNWPQEGPKPEESNTKEENITENQTSNRNFAVVERQANQCLELL